MALINTNYFVPGAQFPPRGDSQRQRDSQKYRWLYKNTAQAFGVLHPYDRPAEVSQAGVFESTQRPTGYPKYRINFFRKLSNFWADLLFAFPPVITGSSRGENRDISMILNELLLAAPKVAVDASRYGTGVYLITSDDTDDIAIEAIEAPYWFPIVDPTNHRRVIGDVIAVPYSENPEEPKGLFGDRLRVSRFIVGEPNTVQTFKIESNILQAGGSIEVGGIIEQRAVVTVAHGYEEDHYGESDYADVIEPLSELARRVSGVSTVLDRFTDPAIQGPESAVVVNSQGVETARITGNKFLPLQEGDERYEYLVYDASMESNFTQMTRVQELFFALSNTSSAALGIQDSTGGTASSGAALRKQLYPSYLKLERLRTAHEGAFRQIIRSIFPRMEVTIEWPAPFLDGLIEQAEAEEIRTRSGTTTAARAIARLEQVPAYSAERIAQQAANNVNLDSGSGSGPEAGSGMGTQRGQV